jgi:hypothetical protein
MSSKFAVVFNYLSDSHCLSLLNSYKDWTKKSTHTLEGFYICGQTPQNKIEGTEILGGYGLNYRQTLEELCDKSKADFFIMLLKPVGLEILEDFELWLNKILAENLAFSFSSHEQQSCSAKIEQQPLIDYQLGSVRDDFDFGAIVILKRESLEKALSQFATLVCDDQTALYAVRLALSLQALPSRFENTTYKTIELEAENQHLAHFAYASSAGASNQKAFEKTFVRFAEIAGFYKDTEAKTVDFAKETFEFEASVIIPVRNRAGKIEHAVASALSQKTDFKFNVIVVDNHSSDGSTEALAKLAKENANLFHVIPDRTDLGIGGCWELAVNNCNCGKFSVQLDSDDLYKDENVLSMIVQRFYQTQAAAIVGSYLLVDRDLNPIPPGSIEHREWNSKTGYSNILRINGLGAPRAFHTPVIRKIGFPNVSYGEDYSAMLAISREYKISRIYEHLYLCRRWEGNSDAAPSIEKLNQFHSYKDGLRSKEIEIRKSCLSCD